MQLLTVVCLALAVCLVIAAPNREEERRREEEERRRNEERGRGGGGLDRWRGREGNNYCEFNSNAPGCSPDPCQGWPSPPCGCDTAFPLFNPCNGK